MTAALHTCSLCPRLCRHACPVAVGTGREAAVPAQIAIVLRDWDRGAHPDALAAAAATLCVDCGRCQDACHLHRPVVDALRDTRRRLGLIPAPAPLAPIAEPGGIPGELVLVGPHAAHRAPWLQQQLGQSVAAWPTADGLGWRAIGGDAWTDHAVALRAAAGTRSLVISDGGCADALDAAGLAYVWVHELVVCDAAAPSCRQGGSPGGGCCGAAGPLAEHHPEDAARLAGRVGMTPLADVRCVDHLRRCGQVVSDVWQLLGAPEVG